MRLLVGHISLSKKGKAYKRVEFNAQMLEGAIPGMSRMIFIKFVDKEKFMKDKIFIGIQDGHSDGLLEGGLDLRELTPELAFQSPGYRPYWIAETTREIWASWQSFIGTSTVNYTGLNLSAWETFWQTYMNGKVMRPEEWAKWKDKHLKALAA